MRIVTIALAAMLIMALGLSPSAAAEYKMYKWVDKDGIVHMEDEPSMDTPGSTKVEEITTEGRALSLTPQRTQGARNPGAMQSPQTAATVDLYVTSWCPYCQKAKDYLHSKGIAYREYDIEKDQEALKRKKELSPQGGVPVAVINGQVVTGFSSEAYDRVLAGHR